MKTANRLSFFANALMIFVLIAGLTVPSTSVRAGPPDMPWINVDAENNWVQAHSWINGTPVELFIDGELKGTATIGLVDWDPGFGAQFDIAIEIGDFVQVSGGGVRKDLLVSNLAVTGFNLDANTVSGVSTPGTLVEVCANTRRWMRHSRNPRSR